VAEGWGGGVKCGLGAVALRGVGAAGLAVGFFWVTGGGGGERPSTLSPMHLSSDLIGSIVAIMRSKS
jgi:hypothetical protein